MGTAGSRARYERVISIGYLWIYVLHCRWNCAWIRAISLDNSRPDSSHTLLHGGKRPVFSRITGPRTDTRCPKEGNGVTIIELGRHSRPSTFYITCSHFNFLTWKRSYRATFCHAPSALHGGNQVSKNIFLSWLSSIKTDETILSRVRTPHTHRYFLK